MAQRGGVKVQGRVEGFEEVDRALAELGRRLGLATIYRVLEEVGAPIRDVMEVMAPENHGDLKGSIRMIRASSERARFGRAEFNKIRKTGGTISAARSGARSKITQLNGEGAIAEVIIGPGRHPQGFWAEYGTGERFHDNGKSVGTMPAANGGTGYIRPTWDAFSPRLEADIVRKLKPEIAKAAKRRAARKARLAAKGR